MKKIIVLGVLVSMLISCSVVKVEKRRYRKGFHVSINKQDSRIQKKYFSEPMGLNKVLKEDMQIELSPEEVKEKVVFEPEARSISNNGKNQKTVTEKDLHKKYVQKDNELQRNKSQAQVLVETRHRYGLLETKGSFSSLRKEIEKDEDPTILPDGAKIGLSFLTALLSFAGFIGVIMAAFIIAWNGVGVASIIISISILVGGTFLILFLSALAFLNIFRRESQKGVPLSKKAARIAGLLFLIGLILIAIRVGISWLMY